jgi:6-phosphogluconolactonase
MGELTLLDTVSALPDGFSKHNISAAIRVAGERVYVSNRGCDNVAVFTRQEGVLSKPVFADAEGTAPRDIYVHNEYLFCANENSDNVSVFRCVDGEVLSTGLHLPIPKPLCVVVLP